MLRESCNLATPQWKDGHFQLDSPNPRLHQNHLGKVVKIQIPGQHLPADQIPWVWEAVFLTHVLGDSDVNAHQARIENLCSETLCFHITFDICPSTEGPLDKYFFTFPLQELFR